jgi:predicted nucleic-acid-binding protein
MVAEVKAQLLSTNGFIPVEVVTEIVYVLTKVYNVEREVVAKTLTNITNASNITVTQKNVVLHALQVYASTTLDFVDCLLMGYYEVENIAVHTFDKRLEKLLATIAKDKEQTYLRCNDMD